MRRKKTMNGFGGRFLTALVSASLLCVLLIVPIHASPGGYGFYANGDGRVSDTGLCIHHKEHTEACGYHEGQSCGHIHNDRCYKPVQEDRVATPSDAEKRVLDCHHVCDGICGYEEPAECGYVCRLCLMQRAALPSGGTIRRETLDLAALTGVTENEKEGWRWEPDGNGGTLTLHNFHIQQDQAVVLIAFPPDSKNTIVLEGENILEDTAGTFRPIISAGSDGEYTIQGDGSLHISTAGMAYGFAGSSVTIESGQIRSDASFCVISDDFTVNGGSLTIHIPDTDPDGDGIYTDSGMVNIEDGQVEIQNGRFGIFIPNFTEKSERTGVAIRGGTVKISSVTTGGICVDQKNEKSPESISVTGGTLEVEGEGYGLFAKNIYISSSEEQEENMVRLQTDNFGIYACERLTVLGGAKLEVNSGASLGIYIPDTGKGLSVENSAVVTATGEVDASVPSVNLTGEAKLNAMVRTDTDKERVWTVYGDAELRKSLTLGPDSHPSQKGQPVKLVISPEAALKIPDGVTLDATQGIDGNTLEDYLSVQGEVIKTGQGTGKVLLPDRRFLISVKADPHEGGRVTGGGIYGEKESVTLTANPNKGYGFVVWMENGAEVGTQESYTFTVSGERNVTAVFEEEDKPVPSEESVETPVIVPGGGSFQAEQRISISCGTNGADIYYTTDGSTPTTGSTRYTGIFTITETMTVKAVGVKTGLKDSFVAFASFTKVSDSQNEGNKPGSGEKPGTPDGGDKPGGGEKPETPDGGDKPGSEEKPETPDDGNGTDGSHRYAKSSDSDSGASGSWIFDGKGWRYRHGDGTWERGRTVETGSQNEGENIAWAYIGSAWWAFGENGYRKEGWVLDGRTGQWYYIDSKRGMHKGWYQDSQDGFWYYLHPLGGQMMIGWHQIDGKWYFMNPVGSEPVWTYDKESGAWKYNGTKGSRPYGAMYQSEKTLDGYEVDENGRWKE